MKVSLNTILAALNTISSVFGAPHVIRQILCPPASNATSAPQSNFYLVTSSSPVCATNSSLLPSVSAISLFSPFKQGAYLLRTIAPGYESLPLFNLSQQAPFPGSGGSNASLTTITTNPFGQGSYTYANEVLMPGAELQLAQAGTSGAPGGGLGFVGCALAVNGSVVGWTLCEGPFGEMVVEYRGNTNCTNTYLQAVSMPPY